MVQSSDSFPGTVSANAASTEAVFGHMKHSKQPQEVMELCQSNAYYTDVIPEVNQSRLLRTVCRQLRHPGSIDSQLHNHCLNSYLKSEARQAMMSSHAQELRMLTVAAQGPSSQCSIAEGYCLAHHPILFASLLHLRNTSQFQGEQASNRER